VSARRLLVIAPHPDDEVIAAWALMRRCLRGGGRVDVVVVSDGGASHPGSSRWPPARLIPERRREVRRALRTLGIGPARLRFLSLPDGALDPAAVCRPLGRAVARTRADLVIGPVAHDAHADHRAVAAALIQTPRRGERRWGYQVWPEHARPHRGPHVPLTPREVALKRCVVRSYRTQAGLITDAHAGFAMTHRHLRAFCRPAERFTVL
jgi:LmbE family N-acetylglucosaminyl deacetylase